MSAPQPKSPPQRRKSRPAPLTLEALEDRIVPSTLFFPSETSALFAGNADAMSNLIVMNLSGFTSPLDGGAYTPAQIRQAYGFNQIAFDNRTIQGADRGI
jgi:hypothetical protein